MSTYRAFEVTGPQDFTLVERDLVPPAPRQVRVRVEACGVCHTDAFSVGRATAERPVVPGHEIVGVIDAVGDGVTAWRVGERVGVGFLGGHCGECDPCRRGDFVNCSDQPQTGGHVEGGYAEYAYARTSGLVRVPEGLAAVEAAPLLCAGLTVFNALRTANAPAGSLVAVQGIGGLGHLGLQYASELGHEVVAIARGTDKAAQAAALGADHYVDSTDSDPGKALRALGGASAIIATAAHGGSMSALVKGLAPHGVLAVVGAAADPLSVSTTELIFGARTITGVLTGSAIENEDNLRFSARRGVRPLVEPMPLDRAPEAFAHMLSGRARFRVVLEVG
ncbi:alcohol dehydrogenase catalytic domain-containing protein [Umezawaea sp. Da 62-37]|uniref:alcohol dehydrogenase catalytic domain-containing protein n=1 Tax=Umezawaea sp. Da 62-37 TaxID=3075927 RepID=UPI0028F7474A|nr:alcohol dehydrogenase catalytic domain-containing protein [Umezawaea sp. Da 62-37]WNV82651.1 alcohol dehydrogenase catalytic domain-containing protein [Umezawaea sp. Da 62-37]